VARTRKSGVECSQETIRLENGYAVEYCKPNKPDSYKCRLDPMPTAGRVKDPADQNEAEGDVERPQVLHSVHICMSGGVLFIFFGLIFLFRFLLWLHCGPPPVQQRGSFPFFKT